MVDIYRDASRSGRIVAAVVAASASGAALSYASDSVWPNALVVLVVGLGPAYVVLRFSRSTVDPRVAEGSRFGVHVTGCLWAAS